MEIFGLNQVRMAIVSVLARSDSALTTREIADQTGVQKLTVLRHLNALEEAGAVTSSEGPGEREGRTVAWALNRQAVLDELEAITHRFR
ncbi:ArsR/SmtB family transcription factor [Tessaracoccus flavescens]|uniref:HTH arsR-type domain-containing protein n=1 Tax=Tessaracoccus flavescens TaxID=399497 RepID=A0A1Q2D2X2_9ACTN|nr:winged helix-turn-helix domain-containing protein [Tessaracoccus flavescens]AQP52732.1 hypothetical protein BW733_17710 [Tessaracoccus flavescens]